MGNKITEMTSSNFDQKPFILVEGKYSKSDLVELKNRNIWKEKDIYVSQLKELFEINNAHLIDQVNFDKKLNEYINEKTSPDPSLRGNYVYYPWSGLLLHLVNDKELNKLRTNRTNNLITPEEMLILESFNAGVAGLSFGNGIALSLVYSGISNIIKIADSDIFETTNLNRVRVGLPSVNDLKTNITANEIYEINPYSQVIKYPSGINDDNVNDFINGKQKLNILFDVIDDFAIKVKLRIAAKAARIPVVMLTSLEDSVLVDVERYDLDNTVKIFHGLLGNIENELLSKKMTEAEKAKYAISIVGPEHVSYRNFQSLYQIGDTLVSRPHLYSTVSIVCGLAAYISKRIALGWDLPSIRAHIKFNELMDILPNPGDTKEAREKIFKDILDKVSQ